MERCCDVFALEEAMLTAIRLIACIRISSIAIATDLRDRSRRRGIAGSVFVCDSAICDLDRLTNAD